MDGRKYMVTLDGRTYQAPRAAYMHTKQEAQEAALTLKVTYGGDYSITEVEAGPFCVSNHPRNGSSCEGLHGHEGSCHYTESLDGKPRYWQKEANQ